MLREAGHAKGQPLGAVDDSAAFVVQLPSQEPGFEPWSATPGMVQLETASGLVRRSGPHPTSMFRLHFSGIRLQSFGKKLPKFVQYNCHHSGSSITLACQAATSDPEYSSSRRR